MPNSGETEQGKQSEKIILAMKRGGGYNKILCIVWMISSYSNIILMNVKHYTKWTNSQSINLTYREIGRQKLNRVFTLKKLNQ